MPEGKEAHKPEKAKAAEGKKLQEKEAGKTAVQEKAKAPGEKKVLEKAAEKKEPEAEKAKSAEKAEKDTHKSAKEKPKEKKSKEDKAGDKKAEKKRKPKPRLKKQRPKKGEIAKGAQKAVSAKKGKPQFRGRFGKNSVRRKNKEKWMKWRMPRGKDLDKTRQYGRTPKSGYRTPKAARGIHPSGYREELVSNARELEKLLEKKEAVAARLSRRVGLKKRNEIIKKANELGIKILN